MFACTAVQLCSLGYYGASYVPGGRTGMSMVCGAMSTAVKSTARSVCYPCAKAICQRMTG